MKLKTISILLLLCGYALAQQEINGYRIYDNVAAPATPASGKTTVYVDSTLKQLCTKDDAGNVNCLTLPPGTIVNSTNITFPGAVTVGPTVLDSRGAIVRGLAPVFNAASVPPAATPATISDGRYNMTGIMVRFPSGKMAMIYRQGTGHVAAGGVLVMRTSVDQGATWSAATTIQSDATYDLENVGGGVAPDGRLIVSFLRYSFAGAGSFYDMRYIYSEDEGATWSASVALPTPPGATAFSTYGGLIAVGNATLLMPIYGWTATPVYSVYVVASTDGGKTWGPLITVGTDASTHYGYTETSIAYLGGSTVLAISRNNLTTALAQFLSTDNGNTWTSQGLTTFDSYTHGAPVLVPFTDASGFQKVTLYANRYTGGQQVQAITGFASNLIAGPSGWDASTLTNIGVFSGGGGYAAVVQPYGAPYGLSFYTSEESASVADIVFFRTPLQAVPLVFKQGMLFETNHTTTPIPWRITDDGGYGFQITNENSLDCDWEINVNDTCLFNYAGYHGGTTKYRSMAIYNGKAGIVATFDGPSGTTRIVPPSSCTGLPSGTLYNNGGVAGFCP